VGSNPITSTQSSRTVDGTGRAGVRVRRSGAANSIPLRSDDLSDRVLELKVSELLMDPAVDVDGTAAHAAGDATSGG
jgi:hypothetical protein